MLRVGVLLDINLTVISDRYKSIDLIAINYVRVN